jgi:hypothetical protein
MDFNAWRRRRISEPAYRWARNALPAMSATEREAIEAGDTWWDADLFTGNPDWRKLLDVPAATLTADEQRFIDGPLARLCAMLDEWDITWNRRDLPPEVWDFLKAERFFGMIIPRRYGGLGFSPYAHSEVVRRISAYSITAGVTVMVPNSLGPGELLMQFGTPAQRDYWLPRLADGREVPCFGLTSPEAGSDAASMVDTGVVCRQVIDGRELIGIRLNWHKRYITLGPVATVLGLAFKLSDPDGILGGAKDIGISVALVPTEAPGGDRAPPPARHAGLPERPQPRARRVRATGRADRRRRARRAWLADADERAGGGAGHFLAVSVGRGRRDVRAHHGHVCPRARTVRHSRRQVRGRAGRAGPAGGQCLSGRSRQALDLRRAEPGRQAGSGLGHHEVPRHRAHARLGQ